MKTIGQAIDEAIKEHEARYPESIVDGVHLVDTDLNRYRVELSASHFSVYLIYNVDK